MKTQKLFASEGRSLPLLCQATCQHLLPISLRCPCITLSRSDIVPHCLHGMGFPLLEFLAFILLTINIVKHDKSDNVGLPYSCWNPQSNIASVYPSESQACGSTPGNTEK